MKRLISIFVILSIILSCMLVGLVPTAAQENYLQYTAIDMYLIGDGTGWQRFGVTENSPVSFMATDKDFIADAGYAFIREFKVPESGVLKIDTEWTTGITMGMDASHDNYPINYAITDKSGKIVFPTSGELGSVTYSNPVTISQSEPLIFDVNKGDVYSFILIDNYGLQIPTSFMARVFVNDVQYDSSGYLRGLNYNAQGEGGWSYKYATSVTVSQNISFNELENRIAEAEAITDTELEQYTLKSVEEFKVALANAKELTSSSPAGDITAAATALNNAISGLEEYKLQQYLSYTANEMVLIDAAAWVRWGNKATGYTIATTPGEDYIYKAEAATIREFTVPQSGTLQIDTEWTGGLTVGNEWTQSATAKYAITDKNGKILFPKDGEMGTVRYGTPVTISINDPVLINVEAGDKINFVVIDEQGQGAPILFNARVTMGATTYGVNGCLRGTNCNAQGEEGWRYLYANSVTVETKSDLSKLLPVITQAETVLSGDTSNYTEDSLDKLEETLTAAKALTEASTQYSIDKTEKELKDAILGLETKQEQEPEKSDLSKLLLVIAEAEQIINGGTSKYTEASVNKLNSKLAVAKELTENSLQSDIDKAEKELKAAIDELEFKEKLPQFLEFDAKEMVLLDNGETWLRWGNKDKDYTIITTPGEDYIQKAGAATIREFTVSNSGTLQIDTEWTGGITVGNQFTPNATAKYAITDKNGKIIFPKNEQLGTVRYGNPVTISINDPVLVDVRAGDKLYFVMIDEQGQGAPILFNARVTMADVTYGTNGCLRGTNCNAQGEDGWRYLYADSVTVIEKAPVVEPEEADLSELLSAIKEAEEIIKAGTAKYTETSVKKLNSKLAVAKALNKNSSQTAVDKAEKELKAAIDELELKEKLPQFLEFDAKEMVLLDNGETWLRWGNQDKDYTIITTPGEDYIQKAGAATIREFTVPQSGTLQIDTEWTGGLTVGNQFTPNATAKYAITDKNGKIIFPKNEQLGTVRNGTPVTISIDDPVLIEVEAGDKIYFVVIDEQGQGAPILFNARVTMADVTYGTNGCLRGENCNVQGEDGWRYLYADSVTVTAKADLTGVSFLINKAEKIIKQGTNHYTDASLKALKTALADAKKLTSTTSQKVIDTVEDALREAISALKIKPTDKTVKRLAFTPKKMTFDEESLLWKAEGNSSCTLSAPYSVSSKLSDGYVSIRKMVASRAGSLQIDFGEGVYIDNASGRFNDTSVEFAIADKFGRIVYPQDGGTLKVESDKKYPIKLSLDNVAVGDSFYFMVFKASTDNIPVVMHMGVSISNVAINNESGYLYGLDGAQGAFGWFYMYANDLAFLTEDGKIPEDNGNDSTDNGNNDEDTQPDTDNRLDNDYLESPQTADSYGVLKAVVTFLSLIAAFSVFVGYKSKKIKAHMG